MMRPILPKEEGSSSPPAVDSVEPSASEAANKRRCISSACLPCRRRKSKCDGAFPSCSTCKAVYQMECVYNSDNDRRRRGSLRRDVQELHDRTDASLAAIIARIRLAPESELDEVISQIQAGPPAVPIQLPSVAKTERDAMSISQNLRTGNLKVDNAGDMRHYGHGSNAELMHQGQTRRSLEERKIHIWTNVTQDNELIRELLALYFTWYHPVYVLFSKSCFLSDMNHERAKYCSPLMVNALLAIASAFCDKPAVRSDTGDPTTAGDHFFAEAKRLLADEEMHPSLPLVQALMMMSLREVGCGRDAAGWLYMGRAVQATLDLGLHLHLGADDMCRVRFTPSEMEVRRITFWGAFFIDKLWAVSLGRIPQLPTSIIGIPHPMMIEPMENEPWPPYPNVGHEYEMTVPCHIQEISSHQAEIAEILGDILYSFHSPKEELTPDKLAGFYARLEAWKGSLPAYFQVPNADSVPAVMFMHMLHQAAYISLFRPYIRMKDLPGLPAQAREICRMAASSIVATFALYQHSHPLRFTVAMMAHLLLFALNVFLLDLPSPASEAALIRCVMGLRDLKAWQLGANAFQAVQALADKEGVALPPSVTSIFHTYDAHLNPPDHLLPLEMYAEPLAADADAPPWADENRVATWVDESRIGFGDWGGWQPASFGEATADHRRYSYAESGVFC